MKCYVTITTHDGKDFQQVVSAADELHACVITWERLRIITNGTVWRTSELGFEIRDSDMYFGGDEVAKAVKKYRKKEK